MSEFKGTPGPWVYDERWGEIGDNNGVIAKVTINGRTDDNGILIAASPELLKALQDLVSRAKIFVNTSDADAVIAKVLGK